MASKVVSLTGLDVANGKRALGRVLQQHATFSWETEGTARVPALQHED